MGIGKICSNGKVCGNGQKIHVSVYKTMRTYVLYGGTGTGFGMGYHAHIRCIGRCTNDTKRRHTFQLESRRDEGYIISKIIWSLHKCLVCWPEHLRYISRSRSPSGTRRLQLGSIDLRPRFSRSKGRKLSDLLGLSQMLR